MPTYHALPISAISQETFQAVLLTFEVPTALKSAFDFQAGQYVSLEATINGEAVRRSYSICTAPHEGRLSVGIKKIEGGLFSSYAKDQLTVGQSLMVGIPEGRFVYVPSAKPQQFMAVAAGSGITPIMALLKTALEAHPENHFYLVYGNKTPQETMFYSELQALLSTYPKRLHMDWVFSKSNEPDAVFGRIDTALLHRALKNAPQAPQHFYLCGPEALIDLTKNVLTAKAFDPSTIHFELFQSSHSLTQIEEASQEGLLRVLNDDVVTDLSIVPDKTILDIALQNRLDVPYSCQGGVCSSCIARVTEGSARMLTNQILTDDEIEEGLVLTCQAVPTSTRISVDYDDV